MQIEAWLRDRDANGTLASVARRMFASGRKYDALEKRLQALFVLEALLLHGGNQVQTAQALGISRMQINRILRSLEIKGADVRAALAQTNSGENHGG